MKKEFKKIAAVAMAMAMTVGSSLPTFAAQFGSFDGAIDDLSIDMDLPTGGMLTIRPYGGRQIDTGILYFVNNNTKATVGSYNINYAVGIAGYTVTSTDTDATDKIELSETAEIAADADTAKVMAPRIEIGKALATSDTSKYVAATAASVDASQDAVDAAGYAKASTTDAATFEANFSVAATVQLDTLSTANYDGATNKTFTEVDNVETVSISPEMAAPFRITGPVNTAANWAIGDGITVTPIFKIDVSAVKAK